MECCCVEGVLGGGEKSLGVKRFGIRNTQIGKRLIQCFLIGITWHPEGNESAVIERVSQ